MISDFKSVFLAACLGVSLAACSTIQDATDRINPFSGSDEVDQGDIPDADERLSILTLEDNLTVDETKSAADVTLPGSYVNAEWPQVGGYPSHAMQSTQATGPLVRIWDKDVGKGSSRTTRIVAPPVVWQGKVYTVDGRGQVVASDTASGARVWEYQVPIKSKKDKEALGGGLGVGGGKVFLTSGYGYLIALDANSGAELWRKSTRTPMHSAPAYSEGRVFAISDDNELYAFNANNGDVLWNYQGIVETARMLTAPAPAITNDVVVAPFASGEIVALRAPNGGVLWSEALTTAGKLTALSSLNDIPSGPVIAEGYVIASSQSGVMSAYDFRTGQQIWTQPAGSTNFPWVAGEYIYAVTVDGQVVCMSRTDGGVVWMTQLEAFENVKKRKDRISWVGPVMAGERLILMSSEGRGVELSPYTGERVRDFKIGDPVFVAPVVAGETIYVLTDDARLVALK